MTLKILRAKDIHSIDSSLTKHLETYWGSFRENWMNPTYYWFVVKDGKNWVGYSGCRPHDIDSVYLAITWIRPEYRGKGLQKTLIKKRLRLSKKLGFSKAYSSTTLDNYASINSLISCGFKVCEPLPNFEANQLFFVKIL